jgi:transitional endoplasmic reticulum ATPase
MSKARRSVTPEVVKQYNDFTAKTKQQWTTSGSNGTVYDIDQAAAEQAREDVLMEGEEEEPAVAAE